MTRWDALTTICGDLRAGLLGGQREVERGVPWELIIEVSSFHYVTPTLAWCLSDDATVPSDVRDYFAAMASLNSERNERMLATLARTTSILNAIDIEPVLLKGAAYLVEGIYPEPGLRILGDIDILIPRDRGATAVAALRAAGFGEMLSDVVPPPSHHHLPTLHDPVTGTGVELHTDVMSRAPDAVIATSWFCEMTRPAVFRDGRVRLPDPTRNLAHAIFHGEIFHSNYAAKKTQLRYLLDVAMLRKRHGPAIDWNDIDRRFGAAGVGEVLATHLAFAAALLGQPAPTLSHGPREGALAELCSTESRDSFASQIERLKGACDWLLTEWGRVIASRDRIQAEFERTVAAHAQAESERAEATRALDLVRASRSWRFTAPLRAILGASRRWRQ